MSNLVIIIIFIFTLALVSSEFLKEISDKPKLDQYIIHQQEIVLINTNTYYHPYINQSKTTPINLLQYQHIASTLGWANLAQISNISLTQQSGQGYYYNNNYYYLKGFFKVTLTHNGTQSNKRYCYIQPTGNTPMPIIQYNTYLAINNSQLELSDIYYLYQDVYTFQQNQDSEIYQQSYTIQIIQNITDSYYSDAIIDIELY